MEHFDLNFHQTMRMALQMIARWKNVHTRGCSSTLGPVPSGWKGVMWRQDDGDDRVRVILGTTGHCQILLQVLRHCPPRLLCFYRSALKLVYVTPMALNSIEEHVCLLLSLFSLINLCSQPTSPNLHGHLQFSLRLT
jgi:hypothetical protein